LQSPGSVYESSASECALKSTMKREAGKNKGSADGRPIVPDAEQRARDFLTSVNLNNAAHVDAEQDVVRILRKAQGPRVGLPFERAKRAFDEQVGDREITCTAVKKALFGVADANERAALVKTLAMFIGSVMTPVTEEFRALAQTDYERLMGAAALLYCDEARGGNACLFLYMKLSGSKAKYLPIEPHLVLNTLTEYLGLHRSDRIEHIVENLRTVAKVSHKYGA